LLRTMSPPNTAVIIMIGNSQNFFRTRMKSHNSAKKDMQASPKYSNCRASDAADARHRPTRAPAHRCLSPTERLIPSNQKLAQRGLDQKEVLGGPRAKEIINAIRRKLRLDRPAPVPDHASGAQ
jgi:hypothetical protein